MMISCFATCDRGGSRSRDWRGPYSKRGERAYNGGLGVVPPAWSRGRAPGQGVRGQSPPEAERFLVLSCVWNGAKLLCLWAVLWSLMVAAVPTCVRGSWVLIFHPWFGGGAMPPPLDRPDLRHVYSVGLVSSQQSATLRSPPCYLFYLPRDFRTFEWTDWKWWTRVGTLNSDRFWLRWIETINIKRPYITVSPK